VKDMKSYDKETYVSVWCTSPRSHYFSGVF